MFKKLVLFGLIVLLLASCATSTKSITTDEIIIEEPADNISEELLIEEIAENPFTEEKIPITEISTEEPLPSEEYPPAENATDLIEEKPVELTEEEPSFFEEVPVEEFVAQPVTTAELEVIETAPVEAKTPESLQNESYVKYYFIDGFPYTLSYYPGRAYISIPENIPVEQVDWILAALGEKFGNELAGITYEIRNRVVFVTISDSWTEDKLLEMESKLEAEIMAMTGEVQSNEIMSDGELTFEILDKEPEELSQDEISSMVSEFVTEEPIIEEPVIAEEPVETVDYNIDWQNDPIYVPQEEPVEVQQPIVEDTTVKLEDPVEILLEDEEELVQAVEDYKNVVENNQPEYSIENIISSVMTDPLFKKVLGYLCIGAIFILVLISLFFKKGKKKK